MSSKEGKKVLTLQVYILFRAYSLNLIQKPLKNL